MKDNVIDDVEESYVSSDSADDITVDLDKVVRFEKQRPEQLDFKPSHKRNQSSKDLSCYTPATMRFKTNVPGKVDMLIGECHINFQKLINKMITFANVEDNKGEVFGEPVVKEFTEQLWYCGHSIGEVTGLLRMENMPFIS